MRTAMSTMQSVEERVGTVPQRILRLHDIPGAELEKRAVEVALTGAHPIVYLFNAGSLAPDLIRCAKRMAEETGLPFHGLAYPWCPCGNYGSAKVECRCSAKTIEAHLKRIGCRMDEFTIWIGASVPRAHEQLHINGEPEAAILKRIQAARARPIPSDKLDSACMELLDCYFKNVSPTLNVQRVTAVATTIARMGGEDRVRIHHLSEALQYQPDGLMGLMAWTAPAAIEVRAGTN